MLKINYQILVYHLQKNLSNALEHLEIAIQNVKEIEISDDRPCLQTWKIINFSLIEGISKKKSAYLEESFSYSGFNLEEDNKQWG